VDKKCTQIVFGIYTSW